MAATALDTFDVDATLLQTRLPQVGMGGSSDVLTSARVTSIIEDAAAEVCGVLVAAGLPVSDIAGDTASIAYRQVQRLICDMAIPLVVRAIQGHSPAIAAAVEQMETRARERLARVERNPAILGYDSDNDVSPGVYTTVSEHASLSDTNPVVERAWQLRDGQGPVW